MKFIWCDTETTGLNTEDSAPFEIAFIFVYTKDNVKREGERLFRFNPLTDKVLYHESAGKVHGYTEEQIKSFPSAKDIVPKIVELLKELTTCFNTESFEKLFMAGYNVSFDYEHIKKLLGDYGFNLNDYVHTELVDVFEQTKEARKRKCIPYLKNLKLSTVADFLGINLENAHSALDDIKATREIAKSLNKKVPLITIKEK